jgi:DNA-binding response OmpR family regulator
MVAGHTKASKVKKARDCGANVIIARPFSPSTLLDRIVWIARDPRPFLEAADYAGPDRRFHDEGPPKATGERRADRLKQASANEAKDDPA